MRRRAAFLEAEQEEPLKTVVWVELSTEIEKHSSGNALSATALEIPTTVSITSAAGTRENVRSSVKGSPSGAKTLMSEISARCWSSTRI